MFEETSILASNLRSILKSLFPLKCTDFRMLLLLRQNKQG